MSFTIETEINLIPTILWVNSMRKYSIFLQKFLGNTPGRAEFSNPQHHKFYYCKDIIFEKLRKIPVVSSAATFRESVPDPQSFPSFDAVIESIQIFSLSSKFPATVLVVG